MMSPALEMHYKYTDPTQHTTATDTDAGSRLSTSSVSSQQHTTLAPDIVVGISRLEKER